MKFFLPGQRSLERSIDSQKRDLDARPGADEEKALSDFFLQLEEKVNLKKVTDGDILEARRLCIHAFSWVAADTKNDKNRAIPLSEVDLASKAYKFLGVLTNRWDSAIAFKIFQDENVLFALAQWVKRVKENGDSAKYKWIMDNTFGFNPEAYQNSKA